MIDEKFFRVFEGKMGFLFYASKEENEIEENDEK